MRRPSPLPPPPARGDTKDRASRTAPLATGRGADDARPSAEADAAAAADRRDAPVIPLSTPPATEMDASPAAPDEAVGLREVWRASRARRKALRAEVRRFTARQRRRRAIWIGVCAALLVLAVGTIGAAYSPLFAVRTITVVGVEQLEEGQVRAALDAQLGTPIPLVDESAVKAALVTFPLVESYTLEARPPHELVVRIVERTPIGVIETRAGFTVVDAAGVALSTSEKAPSGMAVLDIRGGVGTDAFTAAGQVMHSLPESIRAQVTAVSASSPDDVTLGLGGTNTRVVWGSAEQSALKALTLETAMKARPPASVSLYDVSSPSAIVIR